MKPEDIAALMKGMSLKTMLDALEIIDPDVVQVISSIEMVRAQGFGKVNVSIANGQIMMIEPTVQFSMRKRTA